MSVNKYQPHLLVLPEDDANRQLANGFLLDESLLTRQIQVLPEAGGWLMVLEQFTSDQVAGMDKYPNRSMVLLIDFDRKGERLGQAKAKIPNHLTDRVFIIGVWTEPESLSSVLGRSYEEIGKGIAADCRKQSNAIWGHDLLRHNAGEIDRLNKQVRPILFQ